MEIYAIKAQLNVHFKWAKKIPDAAKQKGGKILPIIYFRVNAIMRGPLFFGSSSLSAELQHAPKSDL